MPLTLILTRHAKSGWDDPLLTDHDRVLDSRGRADAPRVGAWLHDQGYVPDAAFVSSARRTRETWERMSPALQRPVPATIVPGLYHAEAETILAHLRSATAATVMIIGHNPGIGEFAQRIVTTQPPRPEFNAYPTCATLVAGFDGDDWASIGWGTGRVIDFTVPRDL
jgi:phosphohistidine phosphatase